MIGCRRSGNQVALAVYDSGIGIAKEHQQRVFQEFQRLPHVGKKGKRGLGLGLASGAWYYLGQRPGGSVRPARQRKRIA